MKRGGVARGFQCGGDIAGSNKSAREQATGHQAGSVLVDQCAEDFSRFVGTALVKKIVGAIYRRGFHTYLPLAGRSASCIGITTGGPSRSVFVACPHPPSLRDVDLPA